MSLGDLPLKYQNQFDMQKSNYVRVSEALNTYADFSKVKPDVLYFATERGTKVHALCAAHAQDVWIPDIPEYCKEFEHLWRGAIAAYLNLELEIPYLSSWKGGSLQLDPKGKSARMKWYDESAKDFAQFLHALSAYRFFKKGR